MVAQDGVGEWKIVLQRETIHSGRTRQQPVVAKPVRAPPAPSPDQNDSLRKEEAVVEFLLINHPLDCPVCDKGGECPLQDISFGWGGGRSRFIEPKRHFQKPLGLSPLIAIDRERCILCYRCVRFSQEISEDYQLVLQERGADTYVATFDGHPYVAPFSGNIIELCPVGALTSQPYRFRARPWDIEGSGSLCTLCPRSATSTFTVRDERVLRVLARDHDEVDDGWLCDKRALRLPGRSTSTSASPQPLLRDGGELRRCRWERALDGRRRRAGRRAAASARWPAAATTNEEGFLLQRLHARGARLAAPRLARRRAPAAGPAGARSADPSLQATVPDVEFAHAVLVLDSEPVDDMPIVDLRIRKGVRRNRVKLAVASSRARRRWTPTPRAVARFAPGAGEAFVAALSAALAAAAACSTSSRRPPARPRTRSAPSPTLLRDAGEDVVIVWGERADARPRGAHAARALLNVAGALGPRDRAGAGLLEVPATPTAAACARSACCPTPAPASRPRPRGTTRRHRRGRGRGELTALYLLHIDPLRDAARPRAWEQRAGQGDDRHRARVVPHRRASASTRPSSSPPSPTPRRRARSRTPTGASSACAPAIGHPGARARRVAGHRRPRPRALGHRRADRSPPAWPSRSSRRGLPFYAGLTLDEIGGRGVRWPERNAAPSAAGPTRPVRRSRRRADAPTPNGRLRLGHVPLDLGLARGRRRRRR